MRMSFLNGVMLGGIAGAIVGLYYYPQLKQNPHRVFLKRGRRWGRQTGRFMSNMAHEMSGMVKNRMH